MDKCPKIILITHSYLEDAAALFTKGNTPSHIGNCMLNRVIKPIITEGVLCIVENICL